MYSKVFIIHELRTACRAKRLQHDSLGFKRRATAVLFSSARQ